MAAAEADRPAEPPATEAEVAVAPPTDEGTDEGGHASPAFAPVSLLTAEPSLVNRSACKGKHAGARSDASSAIFTSASEAPDAPSTRPRRSQRARTLIEMGGGPAASRTLNASFLDGPSLVVEIPSEDGSAHAAASGRRRSQTSASFAGACAVRTASMTAHAASPRLSLEMPEEGDATAQDGGASPMMKDLQGAFPFSPADVVPVRKSQPKAGDAPPASAGFGTAARVHEIRELLRRGVSLRDAPEPAAVDSPPQAAAVAVAATANPPAADEDDDAWCDRLRGVAEERDALVKQKADMRTALTKLQATQASIRDAQETAAARQRHVLHIMDGSAEMAEQHAQEAFEAEVALRDKVDGMRSDVAALRAAVRAKQERKAARRRLRQRPPSDEKPKRD
eukprot:TRINITY_DN11677_c0_g1_i1.p1 TRINITY_DN11677_c0_g1~~TRINITY_DN11677_c0_g1_i1.p1  ORF type:complete len:419 (+),score=115.18 TRINITY_DN11677_c0_g1_i1:75-1259(+)